jgi:hypothetical protein
MSSHDYEGNAFTHEQPYIQHDVYPDHGGSGYDQVTPLADLTPRLGDCGFRPVEDMNPASGDYSQISDYKRLDKGRCVYIEITPRNRGPNRVTHCYVDLDCDAYYSWTFDLTADYASDILRGRDNEYLFNAYDAKE